MSLARTWFPGPPLALTALALFALAGTGCSDDASDNGSDERDNFRGDTDVRVVWPSNGETVEPSFVVEWTAGAGVAGIRLDADDATITTPEALGDEATEGTFAVTLDSGRHDLSLVGLDDSGDELSRHDLTVRIAEDGEAWVSIISPSDGAEVPNPVSFVVDAADDIDTVELSADGWSIGSTAPGELFTYEFTGTGYAREILAQGYSEGGLVAEDTISFTVDPGTDPLVGDFNDLVMEYVESYPTDGTHGYYWPSTGDWLGTTQDLYYLGELIASGDSEGRCFCVGLTWEVYLRAFQELDAATGGDGDLNGLDLDDMTEFRIDWFVRDLNGPGATDAFDNYGLGERVSDFEDVLPGDFVQFWRYSGSGHNVVFIDWERDEDDEIIGMTYWSTQGSTDGIDTNTEYFGSSGSYMDPTYFYAGRGWDPVDWLPWN